MTDLLRAAQALTEPPTEVTALLAAIPDAELLAGIKRNLTVQRRNAYKGFVAEFAFEANCALFSEARRRNLVNYGAAQ